MSKSICTHCGISISMVEYEPDTEYMCHRCAGIFAQYQRQEKEIEKEKEKEERRMQQRGRPRKQFIVSEIRTTETGEIVLVGPSGILRVARVAVNYSSASYAPVGYGTPEYEPGQYHAIRVSDVPRGVFQNIAF